MSEDNEIKEENARLRELLITTERRLKLMLTAIQGLSKDIPKQQDRISDEGKKILADLWEAYPKSGRDSSSKKAVARAWANLSPKPKRKEIVEGFQRWKGSKKWKEGYVKALDSWLSNRKWEEEPEKAAVKSQYRAI